MLPDRGNSILATVKGDHPLFVLPVIFVFMGPALSGLKRESQATDCGGSEIVNQGLSNFFSEPGIPSGVENLPLTFFTIVP